MRPQITRLFSAVAEHYEQTERARAQILQGHDVHMYLHVRENPLQLIHVQGYPGLSNEEHAWINARLMDYKKCRAMQAEGKVSLGNEHEAVTALFPNFKYGIFIPYNPKILETMLEENCPQLKRK